MVAANKKILCWAEKFATFQGMNFNNPAYERSDGMAGFADTSSTLDGELYVSNPHAKRSCWVTTHANECSCAHAC